MTNEQYDRWKDFALRLARTCYADNEEPTGAEIIANVEGFFDCLDDDDIAIITGWDGKPYVCDMCSESAEQWIPWYWSIPYADESHLDDEPHYVDGEELHGPFLRPSYEELEEQYCGPIQCCLRAGLGAAIEGGSGMGVLGFTAGDLRRMYPEGVPDWVKGEATWETIGVKAVVPGIGFVPDPKGDHHSFDSIPDGAEIWI